MTITRELNVLQISLSPENDAMYDKRALDFSADILDLSRGLYHYNVTERLDFYSPMTDEQILREYPVVEKINDRELDEVWVFGGGDTVMGGRKPFWLGGVPLERSGYRRFPIMHIQDSTLSSFGNRAEAVLYYVYRGYPPAHNMWERFIRNDSSHPGHASCGSMAYPPNGILNGWDSSKEFLSDCEDWIDYPQVRNRVEWMSSEVWGSTRTGYIRWWLSHLPHGIHKTDGIHDNWWHYVMNLDNVK